jgi:Holliday junction DNA helicase RuvA
MIALLNGKLIFKSSNHVIVDIQGVGYQVYIPLTTFYRLPEMGNSITLNIYTYLKDDQIILFGFISSYERETFKLLIKVSGIGPKLAINILSGISAEELVESIANKKVERLRFIPGVGKKTAERILMELNDKVSQILPSGFDRKDLKSIEIIDEIDKDVISALENLGFNKNLAVKALKKVKENSEIKKDLEGLLKESLKILSKKI